MTPLIDIYAPAERANGVGRLFISIILKTRTKPVSVSANGNYEAERGHRYIKDYAKGVARERGLKARRRTCADLIGVYVNTLERDR